MENLAPAGNREALEKAEAAGADAVYLGYAAFGKVLEGMEVAESIVKTPRDASDKPLEPQEMASIRVETFGQVYPFEQM
jgi:cyclophilin family peptidyl-prolyl cis-trans isomerase